MIAAVVFVLTVVLAQLIPPLWHGLWTDDSPSSPEPSSSREPDLAPFDGRVHRLPRACLEGVTPPAGAGLIAAHAEGRVTIVPPRSGRPISFRARAPVRWSPSGEVLATGDGRLWTTRGRPVGRIEVGSGTWSWSPVGDCVLSVEKGDLWVQVPGEAPVDVATGVHSFVSSPDGRVLALEVEATEGTTLVLARVDVPAVTLVRRASNPELLGWSPDGRMFLFAERGSGTPVVSGVGRSGTRVKLPRFRLAPGGSAEAYARCGNFAVLATLDGLFRIAPGRPGVAIAEGVDVVTPACGGDERFIAAALDRKGPQHLTLFRRSGGIVTALTRGNAFADLFPIWGRGRSGIVFVRRSTVRDRAELWYVTEGRAPVPTGVLVTRLPGLSYGDAFDWNVSGGD